MAMVPPVTPQGSKGDLILRTRQVPATRSPAGSLTLFPRPPVPNTVQRPGRKRRAARQRDPAHQDRVGQGGHEELGHRDAWQPGSWPARFSKSSSIPPGGRKLGDNPEGERVATDAGEVLAEQVGGSLAFAAGRGADDLDVVAFPAHLAATVDLG